MVGATHRLQNSLSTPLVIGFDCPKFSSFRFIEQNFRGASPSIHRAFSLARMAGCHTMVIEDIAPIGVLDDDNRELRAYGGICNDPIYRISFWQTPFCDKLPPVNLQGSHLIGYIIIKRDCGIAIQNGRRFNINRWYVFEGVFKQEPRPSSFVPFKSWYDVCIGGVVHRIEGTLYCQQNAISKCCAQVALRSLLTRIFPGKDIRYSTLNRHASVLVPHGGFRPGSGLTTNQIRFVLNSLGVGFDEVDPSVEARPYQPSLYSGVESGAGSLLVFDCERIGGAHVVPIYGHTFNRHTWVPDAESSYFMMGSGVGYMPSDLWTSNFLAHDDNFGCNFCIPRKHIDGRAVSWAVSIRKPGVMLNSMIAERSALYVLSLWAAHLNRSIIWNQQIVQLLPLIPSGNTLPRFVLRTVTVLRSDYLAYLGGEVDGRGNRESPVVLNMLGSIGFPKILMVVELSLPQLFPANKRKVGEFIFDATKSSCFDLERTIKSTFLFGRMPGEYLQPMNKSTRGLSFCRRKSQIVDHTKLLYT